MTAPFVVSVENHHKATHYFGALEAVGVPAERIVLLVPADEPRGDLRELAATAAGLVLCGGPDVEPWRYGEEPLEEAALALDPPLDRIEWELLEGAREARTPTWAICRGLQLVNVFLGGTLWQDLEVQVPGAADHQPGGPLDHLSHAVVPEPACRHSAFGAHFAGAPETPVNSRHHQAVRRLAPGLEALAFAPDGVLEVLHRPAGDWWLRGVQWHPENLVERPLERRLWAEFVDAAGGVAVPRRAAGAAR